MSVSLGRATKKLILVIKRKAWNIISNSMFLYTTSVVVEEHVIHLILIVCLQVFLLSGKPCSKIM